MEGNERIERSNRRITELREKRQRWVDANEENGFAEGIRNLLTELYPENAHFIFELLQNAEDADASEVWFVLDNDKLTFEHDGKKQFSFDNVESITSIGVSSKRDDPTSIGKFGVGFKAVFAYTNTPEIYSGPYSFRIRDLVVPDSCNVQDHNLGSRTRFIFPFDHAKKTPVQAVEEIERGLLDLSDNTLLFLTKIAVLNYELIDERIGRLSRHSGVDDTIEIRSITPSSNSQHADLISKPETNLHTSHWLRFDRAIEIIDDEDGGKVKSCKISVAFRLENLGQGLRTGKGKPSRNWRVVPVEPGEVSIYFPAVKETSKLRFHLHAPFASTVARDSVRECGVNNKLRDHLVIMVADALVNIRDLGLLTADFLGVLPVPSDKLSEFYAPFRETMVDRMRETRLTPKFTEGHASAKALLQAKASLKSLLNIDDIQYLVMNDGDELLEWTVGDTKQNGLRDQFLQSLGIREWGVEQLLAELEDGTRLRPIGYASREEFVHWFKEKSDEWLQSLYAVLDELDPSRFDYKLKRLEIVRLTDGELAKGSDCYFANEDGRNDASLKYVKAAIYSLAGSKKGQLLAAKFLERLGVRKPGELEAIQAILAAHYGDGESWNPRKTDLKRFVEFIETQPAQAAILRNKFIFLNQNGEWVPASQIYLDEPIVPTGLHAYYKAIGKKADRTPLSDYYTNANIGLKRIVKFATSVGCQIRLTPEPACCSNNAEWQYLSDVPGERSTAPINDDFAFETLRPLLRTPSVDLSRLIWNTMCSLPTTTNYLQAKYQRNVANGFRVAKSQLVQMLAKATWIPQRGGRFVRPLDAAADQLPEGFPYDPGHKWLKEVEFGCGADIRSEKRRKEEANAKILGIPIAIVEAYRESPAEFQEWIESRANRKANKDRTQNSPARNRDRRRRVLKERWKVAPPRTTIKKPRSVPQYSRNEIDREGLFSFYRDDDQKIYCQVCFGLMPFSARRGREYADVVSLFTKQWGELQDFELKVITPLNAVLCPECGGLYREHVQKDKERQTALYDHFLAETEEPFLICSGSLTANGQDRFLYFDRTHFNGILACLSEGKP